MQRCLRAIGSSSRRTNFLSMGTIWISDQLLERTFGKFIRGVNVKMRMDICRNNSIRGYCEVSSRNHHTRDTMEEKSIEKKEIQNQTNNENGRPSNVQMSISRIGRRIRYNKRRRSIRLFGKAKGNWRNARYTCKGKNRGRQVRLVTKKSISAYRKAKRKRRKPRSISERIKPVRQIKQVIRRSIRTHRKAMARRKKGNNICEEIKQVKPVDREFRQVKLVNEISQVKSVNEISQVKSVNEIPQVKSVNEIPQVKSVNEIPQVKSVNEIPQVKSVHEIPQVKSVHEISQVKSVQEIPQVRSVHEIPQVRSVHEIPQVKSVHEISQVKSVQEIPQVRSVHEIPQVKSVQEISNINNKSIPIETGKKNASEWSNLRNSLIHEIFKYIADREFQIAKKKLEKRLYSVNRMRWIRNVFRILVLKVYNQDQLLIRTWYPPQVIAEVAEFFNDIAGIIIKSCDDPSIHWTLIFKYMKGGQTEYAINYYKRITKLLRGTEIEGIFYRKEEFLIQYHDHLASRKAIMELKESYITIPREYMNGSIRINLLRKLCQKRLREGFIWEVWRDIKKYNMEEVDVKAYRYMISHYARKEKLAEVKNLVEEMKMNGIELTEDMIVVIFQGFSSRHKRQAIIELLSIKEIQEMMTPRIEKMIIHTSMVAWTRKLSERWKREELKRMIMEVGKREEGRKGEVGEEGEAGKKELSNKENNQADWVTVNILVKMNISNARKSWISKEKVDEIYQFMRNYAHLKNPKPLELEQNQLNIKQIERVYNTRAAFSMFKQAFIARRALVEASGVVQDWHQWKSIWDIDRKLPRASRV